MRVHLARRLAGYARTCTRQRVDRIPDFDEYVHTCRRGRVKDSQQLICLGLPVHVRGCADPVPVETQAYMQWGEPKGQSRCKTCFAPSTLIV